MTADVHTRAVTIDGFRFSLPDQSADLVERLQKQLTDSNSASEAAATRLRDAETAHRAALDAANGQVAALRAEMDRTVQARDGELAGVRTAHDAALAAKDAEIVALQAQMSDAAIEARAAARSALIVQVKPILGDSFSPVGLSDADIRKAVVVKAMGAALIDADTKGAAFYDAAFAAVVAVAPKVQAQAAPDPLRAAIASGAGTVANDAASKVSAKDAYFSHLDTAWRNQPAKGNV